MSVLDKEWKDKLRRYQEMKNLVYDNNLTREDYFDHIRNKTELGNKFLEFFKSISNPENLSREILDFADILFSDEEK